MGSRVIHIGQYVTRIQVKDNQLVAATEDGERHTAPCEDIGMVVIDHNHHLSMSIHTLAVLAGANVAVIVCNDKHMPEATLTPLNGISTTPVVLAAQIAMSQPRKKRAWQQLVQGKIRLQASNVTANASARARLLKLADSVKSGDPDNHEAQAARIYWQAIDLGNRRPRSTLGINPALDYGYALVRATLARSVAGVGINAGLGFFHRSKTNPFQLVDDLIEPLRPQVDCYVLKARDDLTGMLTPTRKQHLYGFFLEYFRIKSDQQFLASCHSYALSVRNYIEGSSDEVLWPKPIPSG